MEKKTNNQVEPSLDTANELDDDELDRVSGGSNTPDDLSEMGEEQQLKMQMVVDRMTKAYSTTSKLSKKISDTGSTITQNLK